MASRLYDMKTMSNLVFENEALSMRKLKSKNEVLIFCVGVCVCVCARASVCVYEDRPTSFHKKMS